MSQMFLILLASVVGLHGIVAALGERCKSSKPERVITVPGDAALLNCTLASPNVFDLSGTPYNISWYGPEAGRELPEGRERFRVRGTVLWILNSTQEDAGQYQCILRTPSGCFEQKWELRVVPAEAGACGLPHAVPQFLTTMANGYLVCPLLSYMSQADSYSIQWYKECDPILEGDKFSFVGRNKLLLRHVDVNDTGRYTCSVTFNLTGTIAHAAKTILCDIKDEWTLRPLVYQPNNEMVRAHYGGHLNKTCRVFVPSRGKVQVDVDWASEVDYISTDPSDRVHQVHLRKQKVEGGEWHEVLLKFTKVEEVDFNQTYTCMVSSNKGVVTSDFILQPSDPNFTSPLVLLFVGLALAFLTCVIAYKIFKIDIVLWCRSSFPYLYTSEGADGKAYDAYVVYPRMCWKGLQESAETFVIHTLPQVLEKKCGFKLFIYSRDSLPGEAVADSVQENLCRSRRLMLLYTASTFCELGSPLRFEQELGLHMALLEGTIQVILVELEEVTDFSLFPESVLHLRSKQGALRWWEARARTATGPPQLCPSSRFWKQVRYRMPVKSPPVSSLPKQGCWMFNGP